MLVVMKQGVSNEELERVKQRIVSLTYTPHESPGAQRVAIGITGNKGGLDPDLFRSLPGVQDAVPVSKRYKLVSREVKPETFRRLLQRVTELSSFVRRNAIRPLNLVKKA